LPKDILARSESQSPERRGGFIALHCAAEEPRIRQVVALAPVPNLAAPAEFSGAEKNEAVMALNPIHVADNWR